MFIWWLIWRWCVYLVIHMYILANQVALNGRGTPVKTLSTTMSAEPVSAETFDRFVSIATAAANVARNRPNPSVQVSWFVGCVNDMNIDQFSSDHMDAFFQRFPDEDSITQPGVDENARVLNVCRRLDYIVTDWTYISPNIRAGRAAEQRVIQAVPTTEPPMQATQPVAGAGAGVTATEGTAGTAEGTRPAQTETIHFNYTYGQNQNNRDELDEYIRIGALIRSDAGYDASPIGHLEKFLTEGRPAVADYLGRRFLLGGPDILEHAFYALAAPSFEGKTQSSFVFGTVKPLYFVLYEPLADDSDDEEEQDEDIQEIYKNFETLSNQLSDLSKQDLEHLKRLKDTSTNRILRSKHISTTKLWKDHKNEKFYVLGFLKALILDATRNYNDDLNVAWMKYYVSTNRTLDIVPTSINEFLALGQDVISRFCLFLDEFTGTRPNVFVRNLARATNLKVVVSNTNTRITNLVGRRQAWLSRTPTRVWSVVFTKLNTLNWNLLTQMVTDIEDLIDYLKDHVQLSERPYLAEFFENFTAVQVKKIRPGFLHMIIGTMRDFAIATAGNEFSLNDFLCAIVNQVGPRLSSRKASLGSTLGRLATMSLYLSNAYGPSLGSSRDLLYHRRSYLSHHFYYLINPVQLSKFCFLTYPPGTTEQGTTTTATTEHSANNAADPLKVFKGSGDLRDWKPERTIFEQDEVLPFLSLMGLWHVKSISSILRLANLISEASPYSIVNTPNVTQRVATNGNALEIFSLVSLINASHRNMNDSEITFTGQSGESFLTNLIKNMIPDDDCRDNDNYQVLFPEDGVTGTIINRIHVPFLFPANIPIPAMFPAELSNCVHYHNRTVHFGTIERTKNRNKIDCKFDFFLKPVPAPGIPTQGICTVECKRYATSNVTLPQLRLIFSKAQEKRANLCLLICNSVVSRLNPETSSIEDFAVECIAQKWEVLRLVQGELLEEMEPGQKVFSIERFHPDIYLPDPQDYTMTCIILELNVINS